MIRIADLVLIISIGFLVPKGQHNRTSIRKWRLSTNT
jgi:hypothetical protein